MNLRCYHCGLTTEEDLALIICPACGAPRIDVVDNRACYACPGDVIGQLETGLLYRAHHYATHEAHRQAIARAAHHAAQLTTCTPAARGGHKSALLRAQGEAQHFAAQLETEHEAMLRYVKS